MHNNYRTKIQKVAAVRRIQMKRNQDRVNRHHLFRLNLMCSIKDKRAEQIEPVTFAELGLQENDIEEILRSSIDMLCGDEESMLIVGRQVKNEKLGRSDLTAVDNNGNIVLIEIKRDRQDIENRKEAFEFQAIRHAASYATIYSTDDLIKKVYAPYIEKYREEFELGELTSYELVYEN